MNATVMRANACLFSYDLLHGGTRVMDASGKWGGGGEGGGSPKTSVWMGSPKVRGVFQKLRGRQRLVFGGGGGVAKG
jgi:hypothetical protein